MLLFFFSSFIYFSFSRKPLTDVDVASCWCREKACIYFVALFFFPLFCRCFLSCMLWLCSIFRWNNNRAHNTENSEENTVNGWRTWVWGWVCVCAVQSAMYRRELCRYRFPNVVQAARERKSTVCVQQKSDSLLFFRFVCFWQRNFRSLLCRVVKSRRDTVANKNYEQFNETHTHRTTLYRCVCGRNNFFVMVCN